jgi:Zn-dependent peptidase ImmA (M78 family)
LTSPWSALPADIVLVHAAIPERGRYYHRLRMIVLRGGMPLVEQRATLWHELLHAERGDDVCSDKTERNHVDRAAARRAIDVECLADALLWSSYPAEIADQLKVTEAMLAQRLEHLHPAERGYLRRRLAGREHVA